MLKKKKINKRKTKKEENIFDNKIIDIEDIKKNEEIKSGDVIKLQKEWYFVPHNYEYEKRKEELKKELKANDLDIIKIENDLDYALNERKKIKDVYDSLEGRIHLNSMVLYSGPLEPKNNKSLMHCLHSSLHYICTKYRIFNRIGCIYTGDANLKKINIKKDFKDYWDSVGTVQIPHHGSGNEFNKNFFDDRFYYCPISVGKDRRYGHPSEDVIDIIRDNKSIEIIINELPRSKFIQNIYI